MGVKDLDVEPHMINELCCVKCNNPASESESLQEVGKGIQTLVNYAIKVNGNVSERHLLEAQTSNSRVKIHHACQKSAYNELKRGKSTDQGSSSSKVAKVVTRSAINIFNWKENCFICGQLCFKDNKHPERSNVVLVATLPIREKILNVCSQRNDKWAEEVRLRALDCHDFVAGQLQVDQLCQKT